eukprot:gene8948-9687_t
MTCNNRQEDFLILSSLCDENAVCRTPGCPYGVVGLHPLRSVPSAASVADEQNNNSMARVITALHNYDPSSFGKEFHKFIGKEELSLRPLTILFFALMEEQTLQRTGQFVTLLRQLSFQVMVFNTKIKNEVGATNCSAPEECFWYHYQYLTTQTREELLQRCCCPAILCSIVGPYLTFSVGIQLGGGQYVCDPVTPLLQLMVLPHQQDKMVAVAKALRATKNAVSKLTLQYNEWDTMNPTDATRVQLNFPYARSFRVNGSLYEFRYLDTIMISSHHLVYRVCITNAGGNRFTIGSELALKFSKRYCSDAHDCLSSIHLAPELFSFTTLPGSWFMIVMEFVSWISLDRYYASVNPQRKMIILSNIKKALTHLHLNSFVHGDLRLNNRLVNPEGEIRIIDFEYSGRFNSSNPVRYPPFLNKSGEIQWAPGVECGGLISPEHDIFFFHQIFPDIPH